MNQNLPQFLSLPDRQLAYQQVLATPENRALPGVVFLGGFATDMTGTKATFLAQKCAEKGLSCTLFDYRGHGRSSDLFENGCIGDWTDDALHILDHLTQGPQILVGSSMGGWIGLLLARARPERLAGFVGIAAAPDFTEDLILPMMTPAQHEAMARDGFFYEKEERDLGEGEMRIPITRKLMEDGARQCVMKSPLRIAAPVRLLQGQQDTEVPWKSALNIAAHIEGDNVEVTLVKDATHRFSRPSDLALTWRTIEGVLESYQTLAT